MEDLYGTPFVGCVRGVHLCVIVATRVVGPDIHPCAALRAIHCLLVHCVGAVGTHILVVVTLCLVTVRFGTIFDSGMLAAASNVSLSDSATSAWHLPLVGSCTGRKSHLVACHICVYVSPSATAKEADCAPSGAIPDFYSSFHIGFFLAHESPRRSVVTNEVVPFATGAIHCQALFLATVGFSRVPSGLGPWLVILPFPDTARLTSSMCSKPHVTLTARLDVPQLIVIRRG